MFEYVPTAPDSLPTAIVSRARCKRSRSRRTCIAQSASLAPNVVGSAWIPCVRPTVAVSANSIARRFNTLISEDRASSSTSVSS